MEIYRGKIFSRWAQFRLVTRIDLMLFFYSSISLKVHEIRRKNVPCWKVPGYCFLPGRFVAAES